MQIREFMANSGFKILAVAKLSSCEYSVVMYLINCALSDLDQFITTESELAALINFDEKTVQSAISGLAEKGLIRVHYGDLTTQPRNQSLRLGLQYDLSRWRLGQEQHEDSHHDAVVFPFRRQGASANLMVFDGEKGKRKDKVEPETWQRVLESFEKGRQLNELELRQAREAAQVLVETHPVDQVLLMLRHFRQRIPTLSLLASSWLHYQEIYESENQKVDLLDARQKHLDLDQKVQDQVHTLLSKREDLKLSEEEVTVLEILSRHRHPRRQLFWAYQLRSRYPNLQGFFADNVDLMLGVTTSGMVVKRPEN